MLYSGGCVYQRGLRFVIFFFFSSRRRHTRFDCDWSSDVCSSDLADLEWCERRLLARIHRYTLDRLRQEIEPVTAADFMRFLLRWQRAAPDARAEGPEGLAAVLELLDGYEVPAGAWGADGLPPPLREDHPLWLHRPCPLGGVARGPPVAL